MRKTRKIWLIIVAALVMVGCVVFGSAMTRINWDFKKLSTSKFETNEYALDADFSNISVAADTADIVFVPSYDMQGKVICNEREKQKHNVSVVNDTLTIQRVDTRMWYEHIEIQFGTPKITIYIPAGEYGTLSIQSSTGDVKIPNDFTFESLDIAESTGNVANYASVLEIMKIETSTGNIFVEGASAGAMDLTVTTGKVTVTDVVCRGDATVQVSTGKAYLTGLDCRNLISGGNTGDMTLHGVVAEETFSITRSTGDVMFDGCDASELFVTTDTGDVSGTLLSDKVFITRTDTGRIDVPKTITGGRCEITTDTGNIEISVK